MQMWDTKQSMCDSSFFLYPCLFYLQTGGSKGYAFVEFDCDEVAKIVAETMNNYLMGERLIKCEYCSWKNVNYHHDSWFPRQEDNVTWHTHTRLNHNSVSVDTKMWCMLFTELLLTEYLRSVDRKDYSKDIILCLFFTFCSTAIYIRLLSLKELQNHQPDVPSCCFPGHVIPPEKVHEKLFVGSRREFKKPSNPAVARYNKNRTEEQITKMKDKLVRKEAKLRKRLAANGIDYDFPGFVSQVISSHDKAISQMCLKRLHSTWRPLWFEIGTVTLNGC